MVYGALPPEMRRTQARLFNDPDSGYDVLVASDAVGMGLNLNIRRIIFHTLSKVENGVRVPISTSQIKQIGGEAAACDSLGNYLPPGPPQIADVSKMGIAHSGHYVSNTICASCFMLNTTRGFTCIMLVTATGWQSSACMSLRCPAMACRDTAGH